MQGLRETVGSLQETLNFDHGSSSSNGSIDPPQVCWGNIHNTGENLFPDYMLLPDDTNVTHVNPIYHEHPDLNRWNLDEPGNEGVTDNPSMNQCSSSSSRSNSNPVVQNLNLNVGFMDHNHNDNDEDTSHVVGHSNLFPSHASGSEEVSPTTGSERLVEENSGRLGPVDERLVEENSGRLGPVEGSRSSLKRKTREEDVVGQSSSNTTASVGSGVVVATSLNPGCGGLSISGPSCPSGPSNASLRLGGSRTMASGTIPEPTTTRPESSSRNIRVRFNPPNQQNGLEGLLLNGSSSVSSSGAMRIDHALDLSSGPPAIYNFDPSSQNHRVTRLPVLRRNAQPIRWTRGFASRPGGSTSTNVHLTRNAISRQLTRARHGATANLSANLSEHQLFMEGYDARNSFRTSNPVNVASTSRVGPRVNTQPPPQPPPPTPTQSPNSGLLNPQRISEFIRHSLLYGGDSGGGQTSSDSLPLQQGLPGPALSMLSSGSDGQGNRHESQPPLAPRSERQGGDFGGVGVPHSLRALASNSERRSRYMVSEIRNMLDLMRRGESIHFEDASILDQSVFFGFPDIHDRHRDMRLDVDNMSYEELLALEERIGNVSTGLTKEIIEKQLKYRKYSVGSESQHETEPCCICQEEYNDQEDLGKLECDHDFHSECIKQWLMRKNSCPICKTQGLSAKSEEK